MTVGGVAPEVDVVIPVYNAPEDVRRCVESVLRHTAGDYRLVLIDDASTDPAVGEVLEALRVRALAHVTLLRNETNLGFTRTANRGMSRTRADVVLLNSDTVVTAGWLDALRRCAASSPHFGTVTPWSNNAEICSFPHFCVNNVWPDDRDPEPVRAALAASAVPTYPDLPTGVGFCMYVKRALLDAVGVFDEAFGAGYGEENDLCLRGFAVGYRNVLADDAFVLHTGGRSFEGRKADLGVKNLALLLERHPHYADMVRDYIAQDPLRPLRQIAAARLARADRGARGVLHVIHDHGGGTESHVRALIEATRTSWRHCLAIAVGDRWQIEDHATAEVATYDFEREPGERWPDFLRALCATFELDLVHLHNLSASRSGVIEAVAEAGIPYGYTAHDLNFACPTITFLDAGGRYCGAATDAAVCARCLDAQPAFRGIDIETWRATYVRLLDGATFVVAPSRWAADTVSRYFPQCRPTVIAHGLPAPASPRPGARNVVLLPDDDWHTVAVLGAVGPDKGARRLERLAELAREQALPLRFVLIGYLDRQHGPWQSDDTRFTVHGRYRPDDLGRLLAHYRAVLVLFPSAGPETFAYTLSEAWQAGRPVLVPPIGALAERVAQAGGGWVMSPAEWEDERAMLARIVEVLSDDRAGALAQAARQASAIVQPTTQAMAAATLALYERSLQRDRRFAEPFTPARLRDALGYRGWYPPVSPPAPLPADAAAPIAPTAPPVADKPRRLAERWAPRRVLRALRAHLR